MKQLIYPGILSLFLATLTMGISGCAGTHDKPSSYEKSKSAYEKDAYEKRREGSGY